MRQGLKVLCIFSSKKLLFCSFFILDGVVAKQLNILKLVFLLEL